MAVLDAVELKMEQWLSHQIKQETNPRRREMLQKGLEFATSEFLRTIWLPTVGNLDHLYAEWEVRDLNNRYRYLDLAYRPLGAKGCIEIQGYRSHARDIEAWRFKDLCFKQALLCLDDWRFLPIAYLSIKEDPELCRQLVLSYVGKFITTPARTDLDWVGSETIRYARMMLRPFTIKELSAHLLRSERHVRRTVEQLVAMNILVVMDGKLRYRAYQLATVSNTVAASSPSIS